MSTKTLLTADELERMPDDDSVQTELDEGEPIAMPPRGRRPCYYGIEIARLFVNHVKRLKLGRVSPSRFSRQRTTCAN